MKTEVAQRTVTSNTGEQAAFTIKANGKAFKVLIDGLYADKIQSITREIWSNALDAHQMAGCEDRPFEVSFPNRFDPAFRVRDFGISLSHEQVMHLYTTVFESTKEDTNDQVGKLGLGSKSPFAYTDSFSVTVWLDGEKRMYAAMIGPDNIPTIHFMGAEPTKEENGVEVAFPVEAGDVRAFANAARRVSLGFAVKPIISNEVEFDGWAEPATAMEGDGWRLFTEVPDGYRSNAAFAKMGCVIYPINIQSISSQLSSAERQLLSAPLLMEFPIGALEVTASREELSYGRNEPTEASIVERVKAVAESIEQKLLADFEECATHWERCCLLQKLTSDYSTPTYIKGLARNAGKQYKPEVEVSVSIHSRPGADVCYLSKKSQRNSTTSFRPLRDAAKVIAQSNIVIVFEDCTKGLVKRGGARLRKYWQENRTDDVIWVRLYRTDLMQRNVYEVMERFDGATFLDMNDLEAPEIARTSAPRRPVQVRRFDGDGFSLRVDLSDEEQAAGGIFVPLERMAPVIPRGMASPRRIRMNMVDAGIIDSRTPIYGAPKSLIKKFAGEAWRNLYDVAEAWVAEHRDAADEMMALDKAVDEIEVDRHLGYMRDMVDMHRLPADSLCHAINALDVKMADLRKDLLNMRAMISVAECVASPLRIEEMEHPILSEYKALKEQLSAAYPMLEMHQYMPTRDEWLDTVTDYVILCDNVSKTNHAAQFSMAAE